MQRTRTAALTASLAVWFVVLSAPAAQAQWVENGLSVCSATDHQIDPSIVADGAGGAIVVWQDARSGGYDIYAQRLDAGGISLWAADGVPLCTAIVNQEFPKIVSDGVGGAIIAWRDTRDVWSQMYAQRVDNLGVVQWTIDGVVLCSAVNHRAGLQFGICSDGSGGAIVVWEEYRTVSVSGADLFAQRVDASGAIRWSPDGVAICTTTEDQKYPTIAPDGAGGAIVTWQDSRNFVDPFDCWDIYAQHVDASGNVTWSAGGVAVCTAALHQDYPAMASDGTGGAIVTWQDGRNTARDIYAQRMNASGAMQWTPDGAALCAAPNYQWYPVITTDGASGAIVAWEDHRSPGGEIYAQRVTSAGATQWATDGVPLSIFGGSLPAIVSDGEGGAIVTWHESYGVYAQHIDCSGAWDWGPNGACLCTTGFGEQYEACIAFDGMGGAIVGWRDMRILSDWNIYGQRVCCCGVTADVPDPDWDNASVLFQNVPNPFAFTTQIAFSLEREGHVRLEIFDARGRSLRRLVDEVRQPNRYVEYWDGKDAEGRLLPSGVYFYQVKAGDLVETKRMVLVR